MLADYHRGAGVVPSVRAVGSASDPHYTGVVLVVADWPDGWIPAEFSRCDRKRETQARPPDVNGSICDRIGDHGAWVGQ
ncbi:unnamed protein product [Soboliphyme baturini]|uniref:SH3 domain-containing protein n=1 Tax=Soboliphyme baturini TaxID=241478 RepID=A0A183IWT1_9BILA|nr:unnamed protein product [Soboliphyme baturini]